MYSLSNVWKLDEGAVGWCGVVDKFDEYYFYFTRRLDRLEKQGIVFSKEYKYYETRKYKI